jgi:trehalose synthase
MQEVAIAAMRLDRLSALFSAERAERLDTLAAEARDRLDGRVVWNVNATAHGGGVAEMLQTLLAYARGAGVDTRWVVLSAAPDFFTVTKRIHNMVHGEPGDGGPLGRVEHDVVRRVSTANLKELLPRVRPGDVVLLHDPQTAGMVAGLRSIGATVVWRCHIGHDEPTAVTDRAWRFLRPLIQDADAFVFSRRAYAPEWIPPDRLRVITPSIDPFSAKNCPLGTREVEASLRQAGLVAGDPDLAALDFVRRDGTTGTVRRHEKLLLDGEALPADARLVVQVSRWDRLKDMAGVLTGFVGVLPDLPREVHLLLVGPEVSGVSDDPEGAGVLADCHRLWQSLDPSGRRRVHLVGLPMDDVDENAHLVNALQRRAEIMVQKSLAEGFGLTVTEAMWKARPVIASRLGGIQDQIVDGVEGLLLSDPHDLVSFGHALQRLLGDRDLAARLGAGARERVNQDFLGDQELEAYVELLSALLGERSSTPPGSDALGVPRSAGR